ncbi:SAM-dependent methyltransferase [Halocatena pleomorpha]|uniref:Class I SAM-dependent methyltransferase n=1 Tax=Halocatena pleomorpha TaxID=1785090 RepID=A0A3P3R580_9EURY|nr:class I SAM-dependent methyltransferase [Halocatena pleomorpha]RRJ28651.1 class I SAM-dependent methyltransferase [Halocatena pleomorpha]
MEFANRERMYGQDEYYWGTEPNEMAEKTVELAPETESDVTAIDVGAGEGRDAVFFAEHGWRVYALEVSPNGLLKAERLAEQRGERIQTIEADANDATLPEPVDVVYSAGAIQYIRPENRERQFDHFKQKTASAGVHALFAFVDHPNVPTAPDWTENEHFYARGELMEYYQDWNVIEFEEVIFDDESAGEPHQHAAEILFVRKPN